ncbi:MAG: DUF2384 domain-containing protein [Chromatiales bacterium]|jgi:hypothetical protein
MNATDTQSNAIADLSRAVVQLLESWAIETRDMQSLLALPENYRARKFNKLREGQEVLPDDEKVLRRAGYLLRISDALRTTYPCNPEMAGRWIRMRHRRFGRRTPLHIILNDGESGLIAVLSELDCTFSWDLTGSVVPKERC